MQLNKRGFSLVEILSATVLLSILSVFSVTQYSKSRTKSLTSEAKIQLGHLHRMEATYRMEHNTFTYELKDNMFPKGQLLYNVGFGMNNPDWKANPCGASVTSFASNYYELCNESPTYVNKREECWFKNKHGNIPNISPAYTGIQSMVYYKPNYNCGPLDDPPSSIPSGDKPLYCHGDKLKREYPENDEKRYKKYIAYAVGDIKDPKNFSSSHDQLDVWRINGNGYLEHCQDPVEGGDPSDPDYNKCNQSMGKIESSDPNTDPYCS